MPSHTVEERAKNNPDEAAAGLFGSTVTPPMQFKESLPPTLGTPVLTSPLEQPQFTK